jgi:hypothetical protein
MKNTAESTNGQIIGGDYFQAILLQPSGNPFGNPKCFETIADAMDWAKRCRREAYEQIGVSAAVKVPWTLRITGCPDLDVYESGDGLGNNTQWPVGIPYKKEERY